MVRKTTTTIIDYALLPLLIIVPTLVAVRLLDQKTMPAILVSPVVVTVFTAVAMLLERARPERESHKKLDLPLWMEAGHFIFSFQLGYGIAMLTCELLTGSARRALHLPGWPSHWPTALQVLVAVLVYEGTSYWQHRLIHRVPWFWRFHALHHSGERLNFVRCIRFHAVDIGTAAFAAYVPLILFAAPDRLFTIMGVLLSALGILQHSNIRVRTPRWLDTMVCTPAVHRLHHSRERVENDTNFGNTVMVFDLLFGTYGRPTRPEGPRAIGIDDDPVPRGRFLGQITDPFVRVKSSS